MVQQYDLYQYNSGGGGSTPTHATIRTGDTGAAVTEAQNLLIGQGYAIDPDGIFGPATETAVRQFQGGEGLAVDGISDRPPGGRWSPSASDVWDTARMLVEVRVGVIGRAHGIRGDVVVDLRTDDPEIRFADGSVLREENGRRSFTVDSWRWHSGRFLVRFRELADRTQAEQARGAMLVVDIDPDERPDDPDELYDRQLIGLRVLDGAGADRGEITQVVHLPSQDLLEVTTSGGARLVPFVAEIVVEVDLDSGLVRMADLPGLLDDTEAETDTAADTDESGPEADEPA